MNGLHNYPPSPESAHWDPAARTGLYVSLGVSESLSSLSHLSLARSQKDHMFSCLAEVRNRSSDPFGGALPSLGDSW